MDDSSEGETRGYRRPVRSTEGLSGEKARAAGEEAGQGFRAAGVREDPGAV